MPDKHVFGGKTFDLDLDGDRLSSQLKKVFWALQDGRWKMLSTLAEETSSPEASVSARLRDMRKPRFGGHTIESRRCGIGGLWEYRMIIPGKTDTIGMAH